MAETMCIVLLGSAGSGKSSLGNTVFGGSEFQVNNSPNSGQKCCVSKAKSVNGGEICLIDTPDFLDPEKNDIKREIHKCLVECSPGPHALLLVLKVETVTRYNIVIVDGYVDFIIKHFSEEALKYTTVVFTHGDDLPEGEKIKDWASKNTDLSVLVQKCGGRCHVFDNKHWNNNQDPDRDNQHQVAELLRTIKETVKSNGEECYTNDTLEKLEEELKQEMKRIRADPGNQQLQKQQIRAKAKENIITKHLHKSMALDSIKSGALILCGVVVGGVAITKGFQSGFIQAAVEQVFATTTM